MDVFAFFAKLLHFIRRHWVIALVVAATGAVMYLGPLTYTFVSTQGNRYDLSKTPAANVPYRQVAIVFGAGVRPDGTPTPYLKNRIATAVALYKAKRVSKLLMSADNSSAHYNEPVAMQKYAQKLGVPARDIVLDYAGFSTYDTCYRAHTIFGLDDATLISQGYHLPRAMTTCAGLGIRNTGVIAQHPSRDFTVNYILREFFSTDKMVVQQMFKPQPTVLGRPEPIAR